MPPSAAHDVRTIPLAYNVKDSENSARNLLFTLFPEWESSEGPLEFVRFKDGITNTLFKAIKKRPGYTDHQMDEEAVLLRAYGNGTAVLIDRERECLSHSLLAQNELAPPLLARFDNGLLYRFIEGVACTPEDLRRDDVWPATARKIAQWHGILSAQDATAESGEEDKKWHNINKLVPNEPVPNVWTVMQKWIVALPNGTSAERERNSLLQRELELTTKELGDIEGLSHGDYVLAHCDLLCGNVIIHPRTGSAEAKKGTEDVSFIDYEYATPAPAAFDLANHFAEWGGFDCDFNVLPTRFQREAFLQDYVSSYWSHKTAHAAKASNGHSEANGHAEEHDVEKLMAEVDRFRGVPGLYWGIWALIQATISQIEFDYASYAKIRLGEYWAWRAETNGERRRKGEEVPLRERRWAQEV